MPNEFENMSDAEIEARFIVDIDWDADQEYDAERSIRLPSVFATGEF